MPPSANVSRYFWRPAEGGAWQPLSQNDELVDDGFRPVLVDAPNNRVIGYLKVDGFDTVVARTLDTAGTSTALFAREGIEIDDIDTIGLTRRVVGVSRATERCEVECCDSAIGTMARNLSRALGGRVVAIVDQNRDATSFLVHANSDSDPGTFHLYMPSARQLRPLLAQYPTLVAASLDMVRPVSYPAADGAMIPAYFTLPPGQESAAGLPAVVMPHGGPSARDEGEYDFVAQHQAAQGFAVLQPNCRGSSGYGDAWHVDNGFRRWAIAIGDGEGDHVREGSPALRAASITAPALMFHGTFDANVGIEQSRIMRRALARAGRRVELVDHDGLAHSLTTTEARTDPLRRIGAFLPR